MPPPFVVNLPTPDGQPVSLPLPSSEYPPEVVLGALSVYSETGNQTAAAEAHSVPVSTVHDWVNSSATAPLVSQLRSAIRFNYAHTIGRNIGISLAAMEERLVHGDMVMTKQGTIRAIPVKAKDAAVIASILIDKYQLLISGINEEQAGNRLDAVAARLEAATSKLRANDANKPQILDVVPEGVSSTTGPKEGGEGEKNKEGNNA